MAFKIFKVSTGFTVRNVIERVLGKDEGDKEGCGKWAATECHEVGEGAWKKVSSNSSPGFVVYLTDFRRALRFHTLTTRRRARWPAWGGIRSVVTSAHRSGWLCIRHDLDNKGDDDTTEEEMKTVWKMGNDALSGKVLLKFLCGS